MSNDWVSAFDSQCRSEGLEVPEKAEQADQPSSTMDQNEENKGFSAPGIGRGGVFGGGKSAPPPQTSFGATSGTRMGGAFGSTPPGVDGRGAPLGSSEEGGGNVISVGVRRNKPACTFTRGGSFGTNRSTSPSEASSSFKNNHEGGRFGTLAPKSVGGAFSSKADSLVANNSTVGGSFGSARTVGGSFGSSSAKLPTNSVGGAFGASKHSVPESSALHEQENSISFNKPLSTTLAGGYEFDDSKPSKSVGGAFRSNASIGGTFGAAKSTTVGGAFGRKLEVPEASAEHSEHPLCLATSESSESLEERKFTEKTSFGGSFGAKENKNPNSSDSSKLECQTRSLRLESSFGGGFGANILNDALG
uniref:Uncharacterized protein n=1 Tax=Caenorhabditis japonica TaxID=281687 RepID=A0A8R1DM32_CAEJA